MTRAKLPLKLDRHRAAWIAGALAIAVVVVLVVTSIADSPAPPIASRESVATPVDVDAVYDPVKAGEDLPDGYRQGLNRDQIVPVYNPTFAGAGEVDWPADMLVIGAAGTTEAKAYPVTHLNQREMVIDSLEGIPILVTW